MWVDGIKMVFIEKDIKRSSPGVDIFNNTIIVILISKTISLSRLILDETRITVCSIFYETLIVQSVAVMTFDSGTIAEYFETMVFHVCKLIWNSYLRMNNNHAQPCWNGFHRPVSIRNVFALKFIVVTSRSQSFWLLVNRSGDICLKLI